jgi:hypothetical protein
MFSSVGPAFYNADINYRRVTCQTGSYLTFAGARFTPANQILVYRNGFHGQP